MRKRSIYLISLFIAIILLALATPAFLQPVTGTWTPNSWLFKLGVGDKGSAAKTQVDTGLNQVDLRLSHEIWPDDPSIAAALGTPTGTYSALVSALSTIASAGNPPCTLHAPPGTYSITANLTIPANVVMKPENGAIFAVSSGQVLTINGSLDAGPFQIFTGAGSVVLSGPIPCAYPEWWGSNGLQCAINSGIKRIYLSQPLYQISNGLTVTNPCLEICGPAKALPPFGFTPGLAAPVTIKATASMTAVVSVNNTTTNTSPMGYGFALRNIKIDGNSNAQYGVYIYDAPYWEVTDSVIANCTSWGLYAGGEHLVLSGPAKAEENYISNCGGGIYCIGDDYSIVHNLFDYITGWCIQNDGGGDTGNVASSTFYASRNMIMWGCPSGIWARRCWKATIAENYFEMYPTNTPICVRVGDATAGYQVQGGSVFNNLFSFDQAPGGSIVNTCVDIQYISGMNFFGNYAGTNASYLFKNNGGYATKSASGINYLSNSSTTYCDQPSTFASMVDNNGNLLCTLNSTAPYVGSNFAGMVEVAPNSLGAGAFGAMKAGDSNLRWWIDNTGSLTVGGNGTTAPGIVMFHGASGYMDQVMLNPLSAAPSSPVAGMIVRANRVNWDPLSKGSGGSYLVWYDGSAWVSLTSQ